MSEQNGCSFPSACLAVSLWDGVSSPPQCPQGCVPVSQLLLAISVAAMPLHCEDAVPWVNTGGGEGRDGSSGFTDL